MYPNANVDSLAAHFLATQQMDRAQQELIDDLHAVITEERMGTPAIDEDALDGAWGRVHEWRNHVPFDLRPFWPRLSEETRLIIWMVATLAAGREMWE